MKFNRMKKVYIQLPQAAANATGQALEGGSNARPRAGEKIECMVSYRWEHLRRRYKDTLNWVRCMSYERPQRHPAGLRHVAP